MLPESEDVAVAGPFSESIVKKSNSSGQGSAAAIASAPELLLRGTRLAGLPVTLLGRVAGDALVFLAPPGRV
jgi:hypothetical protein